MTSLPRREFQAPAPSQLLLVATKSPPLGSEIPEWPEANVPLFIKSKQPSDFRENIGYFKENIPQQLHSSHTTNPRGSPSPEQLLPIPGHMETAAPAPSQQSKNRFSSPALAIPRSRRIPGAPESNSQTQESVGFVTQTLQNL